MFKIQNPLIRLIIFYTVFAAVVVIGTSFDYLYFKSSGVGEVGIITSAFFWCIAPLVMMLLLNGRRTDFRTLLLVGVFLRVIAYLMLAFMNPTKELLFTYNFLFGTGIFLIWVPFNTMYFGISHGKEAQLGTIYFSTVPLLSLILPLGAGLVAEKFGFQAVFLITAIVYAILGVVVFLLEKRKYVHNLTDCFKEINGFKTLILTEGIYGGGMVAILAVIPLMYFTKPVELAVYLSATTLLSVIASFVFSRLSDRAKKRKRYIGLFGIGFSFTTILGAFAITASLWYLFISARNFFATLFFPFTTAIIVDNKRDMLKSMVGREWILNVGRFFGVGIVLACTLFYNIFLSLGILGIVMLAYPLIIELKKRKIRVG